MSFSKGINGTPATMTKLRTGENGNCPFSGMCVTCLDGCPGLCEIGKSSVRGKEVLYPQPFGKITAAAEKDYPVDYSHFNIAGTAVGAHGVPADPEFATFPAVNIESAAGAFGEIPLRLPVVIAGMGSTNEAVELKWGQGEAPE